MLKSVRWRLVASYVLVTILAVCLVGVLALSLLKSSVEQQEIASMLANAEAIAQQAEPMLWPVVNVAALKDLAQTASFLGNDEIRILNAGKQVLVASTPGSEADAFVWLMPPVELTLHEDNRGSIIVSLPTLRPLLEGSVWGRTAVANLLPPETGLTLVRRIPGPWGDRLVFETSGAVVSIPTPETADADNDDEDVARWRLRVEQVEHLINASTGADGEAATARRVTAVVGSAQAPLGYVELTRHNDLIPQALGATRNALALAGLGAVALSFLVGFGVSRGMTSPLNSLAVAAEHMREGDLSARAPLRGGFEIEQVARQFNEMAERLEESFAALESERDALRRFIADASHELRTPITALRNFNELLLGPAAADADARAEFLAESQAQLDRLEWITQHLLDLSRIDAGLVALELSDVDMVELASSTAAVFKPAAAEKQINLTVQAPGKPIFARCDRMRLELAISNLLDNAFKFTPANGHIEVGVDKTAAVVRLWVQDDGPAIKPEDRPHIFERFYRGAGEGSGLGLAIVNSVVRAHEGSVYLDEAWEDGTRFVIELPVE